MKYFSILIVAFLISSCCGTKKAIESQPESTNEVAVVEEVPDSVEKEVKIENVSDIEDKQIETKTNNQVEDLSIHQEVSKSFYENHQLWDKLLNKNVSETGKVNYEGFSKDSKDLSIYINMLKMAYSKIDEFSKKQKLAYWINAYNALTIDLILRNYPLESIKDIKDPWDQRLWKFGDKWQNLNDIEHKILRNMDEPRIHFAIVCASESCPKLQNKAFTSENLETQLTNATKEFLSDTSKNEISANEIKLSKLFRWFKKDFEQNGSLVDFLNQYSDITISEKAKKSFKDYDWSLNN